MDLKNITAEWYEVKVSGNRVGENGVDKKVSEILVFDAMSFTEADTYATEEASALFPSDFKVQEIKIAPYKEVIISNDINFDKWYKVKINFITIDEKTCKEKKQAVYYLTNGSCFEDAKKNIDSAFSSTIADYSVASVSETTILDVYNKQ